MILILLLGNVLCMVWNIFNITVQPGETLIMIALLVNAFAVGWLGSYLAFKFAYGTD